MDSQDHDQRFKTLLQEFFAEFMLLFFGIWFDLFDLSRIEWLDKEVFPEPPDGPRGALDLVAKIPVLESIPGQRLGEPEQWLALVHIEIESPDKVTPLRPRMCYSYFHLRTKYRLPVLPIGLYLRVGLQGIGADEYFEKFRDFVAVHFRYLYVGLPALDAVEYVQGDNWLGVALSALMKIPKDQVAWLGAEALRRIHESPLSDQRRYLWAECVQAYLPLDVEQQLEFEKLVVTERYSGVRAMNKTWYEKGIEEGMERGMEKGRELERRQVVHDLLSARFGPLQPPVEEQVRKLTAERLASLVPAVLEAQSLRELGLED